MKYIIKNFNRQAKAYTVKLVFTGLALLFTLGAFAAGTEVTQTTNSLGVFSNTLFNVLLGAIVFLLIIIAILGSVLKGIGEITLRNSVKNNKILTITALIALMVSNKSTLAQAVVNSPSHDGYSGLSASLFYLLIGVIGFELIIILVLLNSIKLLIKKEVAEAIVVKKAEPSFFEKINASVALEKESDVMMDHEYDGIHELDNDLPPWWKYGFYISIVAAFIYLLNFHVLKTGDLQTAEYDKSITAAKLEKEEFEKQNAANVNENNVTQLIDAAEIAEGKNIFIEMCSACHGKAGQGGVGPNLTDDYWIHGGGIKDVFKSIKFGWPDKGMKSWQADLSPVQIHEIASFIKTLKGTNPEGAKEQQGDLYTEEATVAGDSIVTDSATVKVKL